MTADTAIENLNKRFQGGSVFDVNDARDFFKKLDIQDVETVYQCIVRNHEYNTFPKMPKIRKYIAADNVKINETIEKKEQYCYFVCQICKTTFDAEMGFCPNCHKNTEIKVKLSPDKIESASHGRRGCYKCKEYNSKVICSTCNDYGKGRYGEVCRDCQGLKCCKDEYLYRTDYPAYKRKILGMTAVEKTADKKAWRER